MLWQRRRLIQGFLAAAAASLTMTSGCSPDGNDAADGGTRAVGAPVPTASMPGGSGRENVNTPRRFVPDDEVRATFANVRAEQIRRLVLRGEHVAGYSGDYLTITEPVLTKRFLYALQNAQKVDGPYTGERVDILEVYWKKAGTGRRNPLRLNFRPEYEEDSFGPAFREALHATSEHEAKRLRDAVGAWAPKVRRVTLTPEGGTTAIVREPEDVRGVVEALQRVDGRAFSYTVPEPTYLTVTLYLQGGVERNIYLVVPSREGSQKAGRRWPPLPDPLWRRLSPLPHWD